jgi:hypothetical protein
MEGREASEGSIHHKKTILQTLVMKRETWLDEELVLRAGFVAVRLRLRANTSGEKVGHLKAKNGGECKSNRGIKGEVVRFQLGKCDLQTQKGVTFDWEKVGHLRTK